MIIDMAIKAISELNLLVPPGQRQTLQMRQTLKTLKPMPWHSQLLPASCFFCMAPSVNYIIVQLGSGIAEEAPTSFLFLFVICNLPSQFELSYVKLEISYKVLSIAQMQWLRPNMSLAEKGSQEIWPRRMDSFPGHFHAVSKDLRSIPFCQEKWHPPKHYENLFKI